MCCGRHAEDEVLAVLHRCGQPQKTENALTESLFAREPSEFCPSSSSGINGKVRRVPSQVVTAGGTSK